MGVINSIYTFYAGKASSYCAMFTQECIKMSLYLQDPKTRGQDCQSIGKLDSIIGHRALMVNLGKVLFIRVIGLYLSHQQMS